MKTLRLVLAASIVACFAGMACLFSLDASHASDPRDEALNWRAEPVFNPAAPVAAPINAPIAVDEPVQNYTGRCGRRLYGSCFHAAAQDLLRWQGLKDKADYWRAHWAGPATMGDIAEIATELGLGHEETEEGDERFLQYCTDNRLGAAIGWQVDQPGDHAIVFCGFDQNEAVLLGVNRPEVTRMDKSEFLARWQRCGGFAITILPEKH